MKRAWALLRLLLAFLRRDIQIAASYRLQFFFQFAGVLSICITFFFLSLMMRRVEGGIVQLEKYGGKYFGFVLVGVAFSTYMDAALRTFAQAIRQAQITGTFEAMLTTKAKIGPLIAGSSLYAVLFTSLRTVAFLVFGAVIFQQEVHLSNWPVAVLFMGLTLSATMALGIFAAGFIVLFKQGDPVTAGLAGLSWLLSGIIYPKEILPLWVQQVAGALPLTHTLEAMRLVLLTGAPLEVVWGSVVYLTVFSLVGIPVALAWFIYAVGRARVAGSLANY